MVDNIFHLSDIHIRHDRWDEYSLVIERASRMIQSMKNERSLIVITGDIFHDTEPSPKAIYHAKLFMKAMTDICDTCIIAGNHDCNTNNANAMDALSILFPSYDNDQMILRGDNTLYYYRSTGRYVYKNICFSVCSMIDKGWLAYEPSNQEYDICLYHGYRRKERYEGYNYALLGHLHSPHMIRKRVGYAGSLVQQCFAEDMNNHGFRHWNLKMSTSRFYPVYNDYCFVTIDDVVPRLPKYVRLRLSDMSMLDLVTNVSEVLSVQYVNNSISRIACDNKGIVDDNVSWKLLSISFSNMFCYGEDNIVSFRKYELYKIIGIDAPNRSGKTALIDVVLVALFGKSRRGNLSELVNEEKAQCSIVFSVEKNVYRVERSYNKGKGSVLFYHNDENITESTKSKTDASIRGIVGNMDDYYMSSVWLSNDVGFIDLKKTKKIMFLRRILGIKKTDAEETINKTKVSGNTDLYEKQLASMAAIKTRVGKAITELCPVIEERCNILINKWLSCVIEVKYEKENLKIYLDGINVKVCSGFERFLVNLCLRITWLNICTFSKPDFFFIDEGWMSMDDIHKDKCLNILKAVAKKVPKLVIISHDDVIKTCYEQHIRLRID